MPAQDTLGVVDNFRRTWDLEKYSKAAKDRAKEEKSSELFTHMS